MQNGSKWPAQPIVSNSTSTRNKTWIHYLVFRGFISWIVLRSRFVVNVRRGANCFAIGTAIFLTHSQLNLFTFTFACVRIRKCNCKHIYIYMYLNLDTNAGKKNIHHVNLDAIFIQDRHAYILSVWPKCVACNCGLCENMKKMLVQLLRPHHGHSSAHAKNWWLEVPIPNHQSFIIVHAFVSN